MTAHQNHTEFHSVSSVVAEQRRWTALPCGDRRELGSHVFVIVVSSFYRHMSNNFGFMNFPIETAAAFPSRIVAAFPLTGTVQSSLDPLTVNDPWASAVAVRPVQQQHQTQVPLCSQLQGTEFWPETGQQQKVNTSTWIDRTANNVARYVS